MATIEVAGLRAKVNALEHEIDSLRGELAGVREAYMEIERKLQGELVEAKALNKYMSTVLSRGSDLQRLLAPNPACGHPMTFNKWPMHWHWDSKYQTPEEAIAAGAYAEQKPQALVSAYANFCTLCREKEAAVAAALEKAATLDFSIEWNNVTCAHEEGWKRAILTYRERIRALITPAQTSAQQERK